MNLKVSKNKDARRSPRLNPQRKSPRIMEQEEKHEIEQHLVNLSNDYDGDNDATPHSTPRSTQQTSSSSKSTTAKSVSKTSSSVKFRRTIKIEQSYEIADPPSKVKRRSNRIRNRKGTPNKAAKNGKRLFRASSDESLNNRPKRLKNSMASSKAEDTMKWLMNGKGLGLVAIVVGLIVIAGKFMFGLW